MDTQNSEYLFDLQKIYKKNTVFYLIQSMISTTLILFSGGVLIQTFLLSFGVSEKNVGVFSSIYSFTQVAAMIICSVISDKIKDIKRIIALCTIPQIFFYLAMAYFCIRNDTSSNIVFFTATVTVTVLGMFLGVINILIYKLPYLIINMKHYGKVTSIGGILCGVLGIVVSAGVKMLISEFEYYSIMAICFVFSAIILLVGFILIVRLRVVNDPQPEAKTDEKIHFYDVFKHKSFIILSIPNIFRGIAAGIVGMIPVFAVRQMHASASMTASLVILANIASILSSFVYLFLIKFMKLNYLCFLSTLFYVLPIAGMAFTKKWFLYLAFYFIHSLGLYAFSMVVPVFITEIVPYKIIGSYTSWRMMFTTGGTALGSLLCGILLAKLSIPVIILCACALQFISGTVYCLYPFFAKKSKKDWRIN